MRHGPQTYFAQDLREPCKDGSEERIKNIAQFDWTCGFSMVREVKNADNHQQRSAENGQGHLFTQRENGHKGAEHGCCGADGIGDGYAQGFNSLISQQASESWLKQTDEKKDENPPSRQTIKGYEENRHKPKKNCVDQKAYGDGRSRVGRRQALLGENIMHRKEKRVAESKERRQHYHQASGLRTSTGARIIFSGSWAKEM